jgi:cytochrome c551/c552
MPANEQTWRDQKRMHVIFGMSSLIMLFATIWMLVADHNREWKKYQRGFRRLEQYTTTGRIIEERSASYYAEEARLEAALESAHSRPPAEDVVREFLAKANEVNPETKKSRAEENGYNVKRVQTALEALSHVESREGAKAVEARATLLDAMQAIVNIAKQNEDNRQSALKFRRADLEVERSNFEITVRDAKPQAVMEAAEEGFEKVQADVDALDAAYREAGDHRKALQNYLAQARADETAAAKALDEHRTNLRRLDEARLERTNTLGKAFLEGPIFDAFGRPLKVDNIWLPQLTWFNNFRDVARFDRCTTCHQGIDKTAPGSAVAPGYEPTHLIDGVKLATPIEAPTLTEDDEPLLEEAAAKVRWTAQKEQVKKEKTIQLKLDHAYGFELAEQGVFERNDATISVVRPKTAAADALLEPGDVIAMINDVKIIDRDRALKYLLETVDWGRPLTLQIRRGIPHPYSSHPRLDLFVGSLSPHKLGDVGCTICHEGQGTATQFKWASHTPDTPKQMDEWSREHGWFHNHNWLFPMNPARFIESGCLKCHHEVAELEPSQRFPDPPAPKLMQGYNLIRQFGCFGCHEINGFDGPTKRRGPDLRAEPAYFAAAAQLLTDPALAKGKLDAKAWPAGGEIRRLAREVIDHPELEQPRKRLAEWIRDDEALASPAAPGKGDDAADENATSDTPSTKPHLGAESHKLATILGADDATPGPFRKVGPSLRYLAQKVDLHFLFSWIKDPTDFRPSTKMPRFFGLYDHLVPEPLIDEKTGKPKLGADGKVVLGMSMGRVKSEQFEPVEIRAISEYLLANSERQPFDFVEFVAGAAPPSVERGKQLFEVRGCLACHEHKDFPNAHKPFASVATAPTQDDGATQEAPAESHAVDHGAESTVQHTQGPDLSRIGAKLRRHGDAGDDRGERWLYSWVREPNRYHARTVMPNTFLDHKTFWEQADDGGNPTDSARDITAYLLKSQGWEGQEVPKLVDSDLDELAALYLAAAYSKRQANDILANGIDPKQAQEIKGDEALLVRDGEDASHDELRRKKLLYVGRRTISRLGCSGCHDIPGFEDAKPIGTGLADWGRKETSKLAFEMIAEYLNVRPPAAAHGNGADAANHGGHEAGEHGVSINDMDGDTGFFVESLLHHQREGFLWQKLREPRSYDYMKTENKPYIDRLRMPKFNFSQAEIEAVMTFVLGLVAEPPAAKYLYQPTPRRKAIVEGEQLLTKYNCVGCHTVKMETWEFDYDPAKFPGPLAFKDYPFLAPHFTPRQLDDSTKKDRRGLGHAVVTGGVPAPTLQEDDEGNFYQFFLWEPVAIDGKVWTVASDVPVPVDKLRKVRPPHGGEFARYVEPVALKFGKPSKEAEAWGYVPPPLVREGAKVQTGWLHDFLLDPVSLRPKVVLRMPKFNMSSAEAGKLVNYFAAVDGVDAPYEYHRPGGGEMLSDDESQQLNDALTLVTEASTYCVKCHLIGDYVPPKDAQGPNLARIYQRLRPEYLREWMAKPATKLPYTGMPNNFPRDHVPGQPDLKDPNETLRTKLFPGTSEDALDGVVALLLNYDTYMSQQKSIKAMVKQPPEPAADATTEVRSADDGETAGGN